MDANSERFGGELTASFNPRARDGREVQASFFKHTLLVSIHAPVMDANDAIVTMSYPSEFQSTRP